MPAQPSVITRRVRHRGHRSSVADRIANGDLAPMGDRLRHALQDCEGAARSMVSLPSESDWQAPRRCGVLRVRRQLMYNSSPPDRDSCEGNAGNSVFGQPAALVALQRRRRESSDHRHGRAPILIPAADHPNGLYTDATDASPIRIGCRAPISRTARRTAGEPRLLRRRVGREGCKRRADPLVRANRSEDHSRSCE